MKAFRRFAIWLLVVGLIGGALAQPLPIGGQVIDGDTGNPLASASIRLKGEMSGTISNEEGRFQFNIPATLISDTLIVSMLGYDSYKRSIREIYREQVLTVILKPVSVELDEVVIRSKNLTARDIVMTALSRVEQNFPVQPYCSDGIFRELHYENEKAVFLVESIISIGDPGYKGVRHKRGPIDETVALRAVRCSKNYRDSIIRNSSIDQYNLLITALQCNPVRYRNDARLLKNEFVLDSVVVSGERRLYVIHFLSYISRLPNFERKNVLYIDVDNFAIRRYGWEEYARRGIYSEIPWSLHKNDSTFKSCRKRISTVYEYEEAGGKMYLRYFHERCFEDIYNTRRRAVEFQMLGETTLVITGIKQEALIVSSGMLMKMDRTMSAQRTNYDARRWNSSPMVPLTVNQKKALEREVPLEEQFRVPLD